MIEIVKIIDIHILGNTVWQTQAGYFKQFLLSHMIRLCKLEVFVFGLFYEVLLAGRM